MENATGKEQKAENTITLEELEKRTTKLDKRGKWVWIGLVTLMFVASRSECTPAA